MLQYNSSANVGGAVLQKGMLTISDCIISNNEAGDRGSAFAIINHNGTDVNRCTIVENVGGAIIMLEEESGSDGALLNIINSILWNNNSNGFNTVEGFVPVSISYSNVQGG